MKPHVAVLCAALAAPVPMLPAQSHGPGDRPAQTPAGQQTGTPPAKAAEKLPSAVYDWEKMTATPTSKDRRRDAFDAPTPCLDKPHCHIPTLNPGETSGEPRLHLQE